MIGWLPFEIFGREADQVWSNRFATRRILAFPALKSPCGGQQHGGLFALWRQKSVSRQIRNQFVNRT